MTWHLKDRELEKKLIEIAPDFVESLNESLKLGEYEENSWTYRVWFGPYEDCYKFEMHVYDDELEEVPEYNPKDWNDYPKVIPPKDVVMRCEIYTERYDTYTPEPKGGELVDRTSGVWNGHGWDFNSLNYVVPDNWTIRYRPWED